MGVTSERVASRTRKTAETEISLTLRLDGCGASHIETGIGFFDHMLTAFAKHGLFDLEVTVNGDLHVDGHHTVEDTGLVLGAAFREALGAKEGIERFGSAHVPMDESLVLAAVDLSGRPALGWDGFTFDTPMVGAFDVSLTHEFFRAFSNECGCNLHLRVLAQGNAHHMIEATFKAAARALRDAVRVNPRIQGVPSTKGQLA